MDLMENIPEVNSNNKKVTKIKLWLVFVLILMFILIIAAMGIWFYSKTLLKDQFKFSIDQTTQINYSQNMFLYEGDKVYISIKDIAPLLGYKVYNGGYGQYTEDTTKCYINNSKEAVSFEANSNKMYKYNVLDSSNTQGQSFDMDEVVKISGTNLYISVDGFQRAFNAMFTQDETNNSITLYTLSYLVNYYASQVQNSAITKDTSDFSESILFNNQKAVLYNMMVVKDEETESYGVVTIDNPTNPVIGIKYSSIEFMEGSNDFIVKTFDNKVGIVGSDGVTKVKLEYDDIKEIDKNLGLYLVTSNNKQGIVNKNGKVIVYQEYDKIGLADSIKDAEVTNKYILFDNCIPVMRNNLWGLIDINGNQILPLEYDGIGSVANTSNDTRNSDVIIIPELNGIVIEKDLKNENTTIKKYGVCDLKGNIFINIVLDSVYSTTTQGKTTYYASVQNQILDLVDFVYQQQAGNGDGTVPVEENGSNEQIKENTIQNEVIENNLNELANNLDETTSNENMNQVNTNSTT